VRCWREHPIALTANLAPEEPIVFKSILVPLTGFESDTTALETAYLAGRLFDAHLNCLWIRPRPAHFTPEALESHFVNEATAAKFLAEDDLRTEAARIAFAEYCQSALAMLWRPRLLSRGFTILWFSPARQAQAICRFAGSALFL
jgi:hypothetical protein